MVQEFGLIGAGRCLRYPVGTAELAGAIGLLTVPAPSSAVWPDRVSRQSRTPRIYSRWGFAITIARMRQRSVAFGRIGATVPPALVASLPLASRCSGKPATRAGATRTGANTASNTLQRAPRPER
jgi:hypothetical protein